MRLVSVLPSPSKRQTSTLVALAEKIAKLTPFPSQCAPRGYGEPSVTVLSLRSGAFMPYRDSEKQPSCRRGSNWSTQSAELFTGPGNAGTLPGGPTPNVYVPRPGG